VKKVVSADGGLKTAATPVQSDFPIVDP